MQMSEKDIEEIIFKDLTENNSRGLLERGLVIDCCDMLENYEGYNFKVKWFRQLSIDPYGIMDICGFYKHAGHLNAEIIELKARPIKSEDFDQVLRYSDGLWKFLQNTFHTTNISITCTLVGTGYESGHFIQNNSDVRVFVLDYGINGFKFSKNESAWKKVGDDDCSFRKKRVPSLARLKSKINSN